MHAATQTHHEMFTRYQQSSDALRAMYSTLAATLYWCFVVIGGLTLFFVASYFWGDASFVVAFAWVILAALGFRMLRWLQKLIRLHYEVKTLVVQMRDRPRDEPPSSFLYSVGSERDRPPLSQEEVPASAYPT